MENNINVIADFFIVTDLKLEIVEVCESCSFESMFFIFTRIRASERAGRLAILPRCKTAVSFFLGPWPKLMGEGLIHLFTFILLH